jgi:hypothetical protein
MGRPSRLTSWTVKCQSWVASRRLPGIARGCLSLAVVCMYGSGGKGGKQQAERQQTHWLAPSSVGRVVAGYEPPPPGGVYFVRASPGGGASAGARGRRRARRGKASLSALGEGEGDLPGPTVWAAARLGRGLGGGPLKTCNADLLYQCLVDLGNSAVIAYGFPTIGTSVSAVFFPSLHLPTMSATRFHSSSNQYCNQPTQVRVLQIGLHIPAAPKK